jgi:hypothetical protein
LHFDKQHARPPVWRSGWSGSAKIQLYDDPCVPGWNLTVGRGCPSFGWDRINRGPVLHEKESSLLKAVSAKDRSASFFPPRLSFFAVLVWWRSVIVAGRENPDTLYNAFGKRPPTLRK